MQGGPLNLSTVLHPATENVPTLSPEREDPRPRRVPKAPVVFV